MTTLAFNIDASIDFSIGFVSLKESYSLLLEQSHYKL